jgi:threonine dehydrogenase-like Zn-dependent dehydrogenase
MALGVEAAGALPVPALTADQALDAVTVRPDQTVLVHGAGGVTGGVLVALAARRGARVIATASRADRPLAMGAVQVLDYHEPDWPERVRAVRDGGRLATITADLPPAERGITLSDIVVVPDGGRLARLVPLLAPDAITVGADYPLAEAAAAMARLRQGTHGAAVVLEP